MNCTHMFRPKSIGHTILVCLIACWLASATLVAGDAVTLLRTPGGGIEPQAVIDDNGCIHLIYFTGDAKGGDTWYVRQQPGQTDFGTPIKVNSQAGSVMAIGSVRGAQLALSAMARPHVAWMGSMTAEPKAPGSTTPMLYTRLNSQGTAFEPQRNLITAATGLDGGGSLAADAKGHVYVAWHAKAAAKDESGRAVYVARSTNDGTTFAAETPATTQVTGACGCCGMRAFADAKGRVFMLYRSAGASVDRDMILLSSINGTSFTGADLQAWKLRACPMSTCAISGSGDRVLVAWQTEEQVFFSTIAGTSLKSAPPIAAPGVAKARKHPSIAGNARGETLFAWTEDTAWNKGGSLSWQLYDASGAASGAMGHTEGVPVWGLPSVVARPDNGFTIIY